MLIISPLVVAFIALFAAHEVNGQQQPDLPIAIINGKEISTETYHRFLTTAIGSDQLSRMVDSILVAQAAQQHQIT
ncbi:MAG: hypothetical protein QGF46_07865, partial [Planctomycetota bacterium]|nr:hypothetical protein [Planctomycetota bacterium]